MTLVATATLERPIRLTWSGKAISKNRMHMPVRRNGKTRIIKTPEYRAFLDELALTFRGQKTCAIVEGEFSVEAHVSVGPRSDGQNLIDPIMDGLEQGGIVTSDLHLTSMAYNITHHKQGAPDQLSIDVHPIPAGRGT